jgi:hypothetical protein
MSSSTTSTRRRTGTRGGGEGWISCREMAAA